MHHADTAGHERRERRVVTRLVIVTTDVHTSRPVRALRATSIPTAASVAIERHAAVGLMRSVYGRSRSGRRYRGQASSFTSIAMTWLFGLVTNITPPLTEWRGLMHSRFGGRETTPALLNVRGCNV